MTDLNLTEVAVILDRSGSMASIRSDMEGGFKQFCEEQRKHPGRCVISLYQFDNEHDVVFEERDVREIQGITLEPRGGTALLDAVGRSVVLIGERLARKPESERPGGVIVMIITDGHENASKEFTREKVKELVERQQREWNWKFMYLGADMRAFADAGGIGVAAAAAYSPSAIGTKRLYAETGATVASYRSAVLRGSATEALSLNRDIRTSEGDPK